jgi:hypothetical protein
MPIYLEENLNFIGILRPSRYSAATKVHAIVERERAPQSLPPWRRNTLGYYTVRSVAASSVLHYALCGSARWYASVAQLVRDGQVDRIDDTNAVTCKHCKRILEKYLGKFDLNNPDWEV